MSHYSPMYVANNILHRSFQQHRPINLAKLQAILYLASVSYAKKHGQELLDEQFTPTANGPALMSLQSKFSQHGLISAYAKDAIGEAHRVNEGNEPQLAAVLDEAWKRTTLFTSSMLKNALTQPGTPWKAAKDRGGRIRLKEMETAPPLTLTI